MSLSHPCFHAVNLISAKGKFRFSRLFILFCLSKRRKPSGNSSHLWRTYCVQGTVTQFTHSNSFNSSKRSCEVNTVIIPFYILGKCTLPRPHSHEVAETGLKFLKCSFRDSALSSNTTLWCLDNSEKGSVQAFEQKVCFSCQSVPGIIKGKHTVHFLLLTFSFRHSDWCWNPEINTIIILKELMAPFRIQTST